MEVTCRYGWTTRGSKSEVISGIQQHARSEHSRELSAAEVRAIWRTVHDGPAALRKSGS